MPGDQKAPRRTYPQEVLEEAIAAVHDGRMTVTAASKHFGIPRQTLKDKISGKYATVCRMGCPSILTPEEERIVVDWIISIGTAGFPVSKDQVLGSVSKLMGSLQRDNPFSTTSTAPGEKWLSLFLQRHPEKSARVTQPLTTSRANVTEGDIREWFTEVTSYVTNKDLLPVFEDPSRVFNCDETAFFLCPKGKKVFVKKGQKTVYTITGNDEKECITALVTANAAGDLAPPMVVYSYERVPANVVQKVPDTWGIGKSENGWMTGETFFEFITNIFHPWLLLKGIVRPVVLFLDGHSSHLTYHLSEFCSHNNIELISLYPNATHILQPMDVAVFHPLKALWRKTVETWRYENGASKIKKEDFAPLLKKSLEGVQKEAIKSGFTTTGLADLKPNKIDFRRIVKHNQSMPEKETYSHSQWLVLRGHLTFLETKIGEQKLELFRLENVAAEDKSLYTVWKNTKEEVTLYRQRLEERGRSRAEVPAETPPGEEEATDEIDRRTDAAAEVTVDFPDLFPDADFSFPIELDLPVISVPEPSDEIYSILMLGVSPTPSDIFKSPPAELRHPLVTPPSVSPNPDKMNMPQSSPLLKTPSKVPLSPEEIKSKVPTPFKKALFWPGPSTKTKKRVTKIKLPSAITSEEWKKYYLQKEEEKKKAELEKEKRKEMREIKGKIKREQEEKKKLSKIKRSTTESENEDDPEDLGVEMLGEQPIEPLQLDIDSLQPSQWVVVPYKVNDEEREYVGQIMKINDSEKNGRVLTIKLVEKKLLTNKFIWPNKEDIDDVSATEVTRVLREPTFDRWGYLTFEDF